VPVISIKRRGAPRVEMAGISPAMRRDGFSRR
jgi:hypothetical protein